MTKEQKIKALENDIKDLSDYIKTLESHIKTSSWLEMELNKQLKEFKNES